MVKFPTVFLCVIFLVSKMIIVRFIILKNLKKE